MAGTHQRFLDGWLESLERSHAQATALFNEANRQLGLKGVDALNEQEVTETNEALTSLTFDLEVLEIRHAFCMEQLALVEKAEADDEEAPAPSLVPVPDIDGEG